MVLKYPGLQMYGVCTREFGPLWQCLWSCGRFCPHCALLYPVVHFLSHLLATYPTVLDNLTATPYPEGSDGDFWLVQLLCVLGQARGMSIFSGFPMSKSPFPFSSPQSQALLVSRFSSPFLDADPAVNTTLPKTLYENN